MKLNECIIIAGEKDGKHFLAKNRDRRFVGEYVIKQEIYKGIEIAYYEDSTEWKEGMNEYGVGFVYTYLMKNNTSNYKYEPKWGLQAAPAVAGKKRLGKTKNSLRKRDEFKHIFTFKNAYDAKEYIKTLEWNGSYLISDKNETYAVEHFEHNSKDEKIEFKEKKYIVKGNVGTLIPYAGHLDTKENVLNGITTVRTTEMDRYVLGFKNYTDLLKRMQQQTFTNMSALNVFRTDDEERTVGQVLMDLDNLIFHFIKYEGNSVVKDVKKIFPKGYEPKIKVFIRDKKEFSRYGEYSTFMQKRDDLYAHYKTFNVDF